MAMIKCPECGKEISDKAAACPNCGAITEFGERMQRQQEKMGRENGLRGNGCLLVISLLMAIVGFIVLAYGAYNWGLFG